MEPAPFIDDDSDHDVCWFCPSLRCPAGGFDVYERPAPDCPFDPADGFRYTADRVPVCVHPYKVGLPPGRYASEGEPVPEARPDRERAGPPAVAAVQDPAPPPTRLGARTPVVRERRAPAPYRGPRPAGLPGQLAELRGWLTALAREAAPEDLADVLAGAEAAALERFPEDEVLAVLRQVLSGG